MFNGHAHRYERNYPQISGKPLVSYVTGTGGAALDGGGGCSSFDAYSIGSGGACNTATVPDANVYGFLLVTVNGNKVTVTPTDSTGRTFDVQTYTIPGTTPTNDFSLSASPPSASVTAGSAATSTINTAVTSGAAQSVALSATGLPTGATATFTPSSVTAGSSSSLSISTLSGTTPGPYTVTITGTGTSATHTTTFALTVTAPVTNDFSLSASPPSASVTAGLGGHQHHQHRRDQRGGPVGGPQRHRSAHRRDGHLHPVLGHRRVELVPVHLHAVGDHPGALHGDHHRHRHLGHPHHHLRPHRDRTGDQRLLPVGLAALGQRDGRARRPPAPSTPP